MTLGIQNTKEVLDALFTGQDVFIAAKADGKIDLADLGLLFQLVPKLGPAVADANVIPAELADLDSGEGAELVAYVSTRYAVGSDKAKEMVKYGAEALVALVKLNAVRVRPEPVVPAPVAG